MINVHSIRFKIIAVLIGVLIAALLVQTLYISPLIQKKDLREAMDYQAGLAAQIATDMDASLRRGIAELEAIAKFPSIASMDRGRLDEALGRADRITQFFNYYFVMDTTGQWVSFPSNPARVGQRIPERNMGWVRKTFSEDGTVFLNAIVSNVNSLVSGFSTPVRSEDGHQVGLLRGVLLISSDNSLMKAVKRTRVGDNGYAYIVSSNGWLLAHPALGLEPESFKVYDYTKYAPVSEAIAGRSGMVEYEYEGQTWIAAYRPIESTGWGIVVQQPMADVIRNAEDISSVLRNSMVAIMLLAALVLSVVFAFALRPLSRLVRDIRARAPLGKRFFSRDEIGQLAREFDSLYTRLAHSEAELEQRVSERTAELTRANEQLVLQAHERKQAQDKIKLLGSLIDRSNDAFFITDPETGAFLDVNEEACRALRYTKDELLEMKVSDIEAFLPDNFSWKAHIEEVRRRGHMILEGEHRRKDGTTFPVEANIKMVQVESRDFLVALTRDITTRRKDEAALRQSEEKFSTAFRSSPSWLTISRLSDGKYIDINDTFLSTTGYNRSEVIGHTSGELGIWVVPSERERMVRELKRNGRVMNQEVEFRGKSGATRTTLWSAELIELGGEVCQISMTQDITKHKRAEEALRCSEKEYRDLVNSALVGIFKTNLGGEILYLNDALMRIFDYESIEEAKAEGVSNKYKDPADRETILSVLRRDGSVDGYELDYITKQGRTINCLLSASLDGQTISGMILDITERKKMENEILQVKQDWEDTFNTITDMVTVHDSDFNIIQANKAAEKILGLPLLSNSPVKCFEHYHGTASPPVGCPSCICLKDGKPGTFEVFESHLGMFIEIRGIPRFDKDGKLIGLIHIVRDITERKQAEDERTRLEEQLRQSQKMEAVGQLAGGVAHDFNNILTAMMGYGNILKMRLDEDDPLRQYVQQILNSSDRAAELTKSLLTFSRKQKLCPVPLRANEIVSGSLALLGRLIGADIELKAVMAEPELTVMADAGQMQQVLMNLVTNARDAMPEGGTLTISSEVVELDADAVRALGYGEPGRYALLSVHDTGQGMEAETSERIFEPFFTTKEKGKGTGLGLAIAYGIVNQHGGHIDVHSTPGSGSRFDVYLPEVEPPAKEAVVVMQTGPVGGTETVLLAEDDPDVRVLVRESLMEAGYRVIEATDGEEAIEEFRAHHDEIHMVLLDVIMPKKSGKDVYEATRRMNPDVKVLFMSGYMGDVLHSKGILAEGLNFIAKPVTPPDLLRKIREVLDGAEPARSL